MDLADVSDCRRRLLAAVIPVLAVGLTGSGAALAVLRSAEPAPSASTSFFANFKGLKLQDPFAKRMGADLSGWTFATGRPEDVEKLSDALRLFRPGGEVRKLEDHSTALWLVDAQGQLRMRYSGNPPDVPRLLREIAALDKLANRPE